MEHSQTKNGTTGDLKGIGLRQKHHERVAFETAQKKAQAWDPTGRCVELWIQAADLELLSQQEEFGVPTSGVMSQRTNGEKLGCFQPVDVMIHVLRSNLRQQAQKHKDEKDCLVVGSA